MNISTPPATGRRDGRSPSISAPARPHTASNNRRLTREEETELCARMRRGDREALDKLISAHRDVAWSAANEYRGFGLPVEDIAQEAMRGLLIAADRFSPTRGPRFCSYAWFYAKKYALRAVENQALLIRLPSRVWRDRRVGELRSRFTSYPGDLSRDAGQGVEGHRADEAQAYVESVLERLSPRERAVLMKAFDFPDAERLDPRPSRREVTTALRRLRELALGLKGVQA